MNPEPAWTSFLSFSYRLDLDQLIGRWLRPVDDAELRMGYEALRAEALRHGCGYWLMDARRRTDRSRNGREWVTTEFLPAVQQELGRPLRVAFLVLPDHWREAGPAGEQGAFRFARFIEEKGADVWLEGQQEEDLGK